jgi:hypothetical protein
MNRFVLAGGVLEPDRATRTCFHPAETLLRQITIVWILVRPHLIDRPSIEMLLGQTIVGPIFGPGDEPGAIESSEYATFPGLVCLGNRFL